MKDALLTKSDLDSHLKSFQIKIGGMLVALGGTLIAIKFFVS